MKTTQQPGDKEMKTSTSDIAFTPSVKAVQERMGSRAQYQRMEERGGWQNEVTLDRHRLPRPFPKFLFVFVGHSP